MKCSNHPDVEATAACTRCGKAVCASCAVSVAGQIVCQQCLAAGPSQPAAVASATTTNGLAIVSVILGGVGLIGCCCTGAGLIFGTPAAIMGFIARKQIAESAGRQKGIELATIGLILGIVEAVIAILMIILMFAGFGLNILGALLAGSTGY